MMAKSIAWNSASTTERLPTAGLPASGLPTPVLAPSPLPSSALPASADQVDVTTSTPASRTAQNNNLDMENLRNGANRGQPRMPEDRGMLHSGAEVARTPC